MINRYCYILNPSTNYNDFLVLFSTMYMATSPVYHQGLSYTSPFWYVILYNNRSTIICHIWLQVSMVRKTLPRFDYRSFNGGDYIGLHVCNMSDGEVAFLMNGQSLQHQSVTQFWPKVMQNFLCSYKKQKNKVRRNIS